MTYFKTLNVHLEKIDKLFKKCDSWLILISADPDAMSSAMALKRLMLKKIKKVDIAKINEITRPDNLAMIRNLKIHMLDFDENLISNYDRFALVDSQPHHSPLFENINFSIIIDHHPIPENPYKAENDDSHIDIRPKYGATATMMTEYLYSAKIKPAKFLAIALQYGIRTDTGIFGRQSTEIDLRAYNYLGHYADQNILLSIIKSEYLPEWLPYFSKAFETLKNCGLGNFTYLSKVNSPDILVVIADFFLKVHGLKYIIVAGIYNKSAICIFRGTTHNLGILAQKAFSEYGSAGGHKQMARAEIPLENITEKICPNLIINLSKKKLSKQEDIILEEFLFGRLKQFGTKKELG